MKELSIEEKAKAYDEAVAVTKKLVNVGLVYEDDAIQIFPELKESEDEKIRRNIIAAHKGEGYYDSDLPNECIAWLEKQGNEPNWCHHKVDLSGCSEEYRKAYYGGWNNCNMQHSQCASEKNDVIKCIINGMKCFYEDNKNATWGTDKWSMPVKHIIDVLEKQSEPKPTDKIELKKINSPVLSSSSNIGTNVPTEWSGQDESRLTHILRLLYFKDDKKYLLMFGLNNLQELEKDIAWLKSLKDRVQPKQEWSEEDEQNLNAALGYINDEYLRRWLKDAIYNKYEKQWKPSEEQINALDSTLQYSQVSHNSYEYLNSLYNDLKKLIE